MSNNLLTALRRQNVNLCLALAAMVKVRACKANCSERPPREVFNELWAQFSPLERGDLEDRVCRCLYARQRGLTQGPDWDQFLARFDDYGVYGACTADDFDEWREGFQSPPLVPVLKILLTGNGRAKNAQPITAEEIDYCLRGLDMLALLGLSLFIQRLLVKGCKRVSVLPDSSVQILLPEEGTLVFA